jgi:hypothetical protein
MEKLTIFDDNQEYSQDFYKKNGYAHFRINSKKYRDLVNKGFKYYSDGNASKQKIAFKNKDGKPKHFVDIFRDPSSPAYDIFKNDTVIKIIKNHIYTKNRLIFTHSKMSFKNIGGISDWHPHQDNGYNFGKNKRDGFALFICLEDMNESNGCLQIYPESHLLGPLNHSRKIENVESGDNQLLIRDMPIDMLPISVIAEKGDIIIFSPTTIHSSLSTKTKSKRLSLIAEIKEFTALELDDYGKIPIFIFGSINIFERLVMLLSKALSFQIYWSFLKKSNRISMFIRKILYRYR